MPRYLNKLEPTMPTPAYLLKTAAKNGHAEAIRIVLEALPKNPQRPSYPWDPPWLACVPFSEVPEKWKTIEDSIALTALEGNDALSVIKLFFEYVMEPNYDLHWAINPMAMAISRGNIDLARFLLSRGAKPSGRYIQPEDTFLGAAARLAKPDMLNLLIEHGVKIEGSQALRQAAQNGQVHNAKILLELGADVNERFTRYDYVENKNKTLGYPLNWAVIGQAVHFHKRQASEAETVRFLLSQGAKADVLDGAGRTPFQLAVEKNEHSIVDAFKDHGIES